MAEAAYYRLENKIVTRGKGHSAVAAAAYNAAEKLYDERTGTTYDFTRKQDVYHSEILAPANAPAWVFDRKQLWNQAESHEKRVDSQVARQLILSLPNCLSHDEKLHVTRRFLQRECVAMGMAADVSFHDFEGDKSHNPHAHVLLTMREVGSDGFAAKKNRNWNKVVQHQLWRERWADHLNRHFEQKGYDARVDHRSYAAQGIDRIPQIHEGRAVKGIRDQIANGQRTQTTSAIDFNSKVMEYNQLQREIATLQREIAEEEERQQQDVQQKVQEQDHTAASRSKTPSSAAEEITSNAMQAALLDKKLARQDASIKKQKVQSPAKSTENAPSHARPNAPPREPRDRTYLAVKNQLIAMGGNGWFEIGIRHDAEDAAESYFYEKTWHKDHLLKVDPETGKTPVLNYLKAENARGSHIYIRPARLPSGDTQGLILIDDLDPVMVEDLHDKGLQPCVVVETSHKNCQAWIKVSDRLEREEASHLAKILTQEAGGDPGSAGYQHYGRLAGFTNRKEEHFDVYSGKYPWVLLREAQHRQSSQATHFQELARRAAADEKAKLQEAMAKRADLLKHKSNAAELKQAVLTFERLSTSVQRKYGITDPSRRDWVILKRMAKRGYSLEALEYALHHSADLDDRKKGHQEDYVRRTVEKVSHDPDVITHLERKRQKQEQKQPPRAEGRAAEDARKLHQQRHYYQHRDRSGSASSERTGGTMKQPGEKTSGSSSGKGPTIRTSQYTVEQLPIHSLGKMDADVVRYVTERTLHNQSAEKRQNKALWALHKDADIAWKDKAKAEYLKERGRLLLKNPEYALTPHSDAEIAFKMQMAGFGNRQIKRILEAESPFIHALPDLDSRRLYLSEGIAPVLHHPNTRHAVRQFWQQRTQQALALPPGEKEAFLQETKFDKLNIATDLEPHPAVRSAAKVQKQQQLERER